MQQKLDELTRLNDEMQRHMDRFAGLLKIAYDSPNPVNMRLLRQESRAMNQQADLLNQQLANMKETSTMKRNALALLLIALMIFVTSFAVAQDIPLATNTPQIVQGTATWVSSEPIPTEAPAPVVVTDVPAATAEPPVIIVNPPPAPVETPSDRSLLVFGLLGFAIISAISQFLTTKQVGAVLEVVNNTLNNKQLIDEAHQRYMQASLSTQEFVNLLRGFATFLGTMNIPIIDTTVDKLGEFLGNVSTPGESNPPAASPGQTKPLDGDPYLGSFPDQYPVDGRP